MTRTALLTTAMLIGFAGAAAAECSWGYGKTTTAEAETFTPAPTADATDATDIPDLLLPLTEDAVTGEG